jgi:outer membrane protein assembly factor BamC
MLSLGANPAQAAQALEQAKNVSAARLVQRQDKVWAEVGDGLDRAWRRVGLALDRTGFTVEDRNRSTGTYAVRFVPALDEKPSGRWFSKKPDAQPVRYQILVQTEGPISRVSVQNEQGQALNDANAQRILKVLVDDLK